MNICKKNIGLIIGIMVVVLTGTPGANLALAFPQSYGAPGRLDSTTPAQLDSPTTTPSIITPTVTTDTPVVTPVTTADTPVSGGGEGGPRFIDVSKVPPTMNFDAPFKGAGVSGAVTIKARARAFGGVPAEYVQFYVDEKPISGEITNWGDEQSGKYDVSGFRVLWDTTRVTNGSHTIKARGHNNGQDTIISLDVTVNNKDPLKVKTTVDTNQNTRIRSQRNADSTGILNVLSKGDLYIAGRGYLGRNGRIIRLFAGTYTVFALSPSTDEVCWVKDVIITGGKTTLMRVSGIPCR